MNKINKLFVTILAGAILTSSVSAQSISLTNIFGGDADTAGKDVISFDKDWNKKEMSFGDRVQFDLSSEKVDSRIRLDLATTALDGKNSTLRLRGYFAYKPWEFLNIIAGNNFFSKYAVSTAQLLAVDDYVNHGKLCDDNGLGVLFNFADLTVAASIAAEGRLNLNLGATYKIKDIASFGVTVQDVTTEALSFGLYAGLLAVDNLKLNAGYIYNYNNSSYITPAKNVAQLSAAYNFTDLGLGLFADVQVSIAENISVFSAVRATYKVTSNASLNAKVTANIDSDTVKVVAYPFADIKIPLGTIRTGVRVNISKDGYTGLSLPLSWTYKFSK